VDDPRAEGSGDIHCGVSAAGIHHNKFVGNVTALQGGAYPVRFVPGDHDKA